MIVRELIAFLEHLPQEMSVEFHDCTYDRRCPVNKVGIGTMRGGIETTTNGVKQPPAHGVILTNRMGS